MNFRTTIILLIVLAAVGGYLFFTRAPAPPPAGPGIETKNPQQLLDLVGGREFRTLSGVDGAVTAVALSPDSTQAFSANGYKTLTRWDIASGRAAQTLTGENDSPICVAISPDGKSVLSGDLTGAMKLRDISGGNAPRTFSGHTATVTSVAFNPDGHTALSGSDDKTLRLWDLTSGSAIRTFAGHTGAVTSVAISPDGHTAASASADKTIRIWNLDTGSVLQTLSGHADKVNAVVFTPDGKMLLSASDDKTLKLWNAATGELIRTFDGHSSAVACVAISPDGTLAASGGGDGSLKLWDLASGRQLRSFTTDGGSIGGVTFTSNGHMVLSGEADGTLKLWDIARDVSRITITRADGSLIVLERRAPAPFPETIRPAFSAWQITSPAQMAADPYMADDLLEAIVNATSNAEVKIGGDAASYGLDSPQFKIDLTTTVGGKTESIAIGRQVATGNELYARVDSQDVAQVIGGELLDKVDTTAEKLRLTKLLDVDTSLVNNVTIDRPSQPLTLSKFPDQWVLSEPTTRPTTRPADGPLTSELLSAIDSLRANSFAGPNDDITRLMSQPQAKLTLRQGMASTQPSTRPEEGTFATIEFSQPDLLGKTVWVRVMPMNIVASIPKDTADSILKSPLDLLDHDVVKIDPNDVIKIGIAKSGAAGNSLTGLQRRPAVKADLATKVLGPFTQPTTTPSTMPATQPAAPPSAWVVDWPKKSDADDTKVDALLGQFHPLHVDKFLAAPPASRPATAPPTNWTIILTTNHGVFKVDLRDPGESSSDPVVGEYQGQSFELPRTIISSLNVDFTPSSPSATPPPAP